MCPVCGAAHAVCTGRTSNRTVPVGYGAFGPEAGPAIGPNILARARIYEVTMANQFTASERLYLNADGKVVGADDPNRVSLLAAEGTSMPIERAQELGLVDADGNAVNVRTAEETPDEGEVKAKAASANKARAASDNK